MDDLYHQTMTALEQSLHCRLIASELDLERGVSRLEASDQEILAQALPSFFSRIPLYSSDPQPGERTITHIALIDLKGKCVQQRRPVTVEDVISGSTPIARAIELLSLRPFFFVLDPDCIRRILTRSDLNRLPVRTYLHTLLDHAEGLFAQWCEAIYPDETWLGCLTCDRQARVQELYCAKQQADFDTRLIDCTTFSDKANIVGKSERFRAQLLSLSRRKFQAEFMPIKRLRDRLDHGLPPLAADTDRLRDHLSHGGPLTKQADLAWLDGVVRTLRDWIEALSQLEVERMNDGA